MGLFIFLVYLFFEILFTYEFAEIFSVVGLFFEVLFTLLVGIIMIKNLNFSLLETMQRVMRGEIDSDEFVSIGLFKFIGALLIFVPGIFSDLIGLLMIFEPVAIFFARKFLKPKSRDFNYNKRDDFNEEIIDVEIIEEKK